MIGTPFARCSIINEETCGRTVGRFYIDIGRDSMERRIGMATAARTKATFTLPSDLMNQIQELVDSGEAASADGLVERALANELRRSRRQRLRAEYERAAEDPDFRKDMAEIESAFQTVDSETARMLDED